MSRNLRTRNTVPMTVDLSDSDNDSAIQIIEDSDSDIEYLPKENAKTKDKATTLSGANPKCQESVKKSFSSDNAPLAITEHGSSEDTELNFVHTDDCATIEDDIRQKEPDTSSEPKGVKRKAPSKTTAAKRIKTTTLPTKKTKSRGKNTEDNKDSETQLNVLSSKGPESFNSKLSSDSGIQGEWSEAEFLCEFNNIEPRIAENIISLFQEENTIPFIARYRREKTGGMDPDQLRDIKNSYDNLKLIRQKALSILKSIDKLGKWSPEIHAAITAAKSMNELEHIYAPFKPGSKRSLAERAKELGLSNISKAVMEGKEIPSLTLLTNKAKEGLKNEQEIKLGIVHIIADVMSKDKTTFDMIRELRKSAYVSIESTLSKSANSKTSKDTEPHPDQQKYQNYFNFKASEKSIRDHQVLAINRGEAQKILSVKIHLPDWFQHRLKNHCLLKYNIACRATNFHRHILEESFDDAYNRLIKPFITRQIRHELHEKATKASIEVFASNLKKLLLIPPFRGKPVLGIDPGFKHGCKLAVISQHGNVLETVTIYPHISHTFNNRKQCIDVLVGLVKQHSCRTIALGNATACRETEIFLSDVIQSGAFRPLDVTYTIVNEAGASIYSCSSEAKFEFPNVDPNLISAISIARRLQDPLAELVKVEPKHLGVGMYQHDVPEKQLQHTLSEVISETVSFVGVDVNTASQCLLRRVAGLNATRAANIIERRDKIGPFQNRQDLLKVKGIGKKTFEQCAGFIRILPQTAGVTGEKYSVTNSLDYLDQTWIHPESYDVARRFLRVCHCDLKQLGTADFIAKITSYASVGLPKLAKDFGMSETSMEIIIKGLSMEIGEDIRVKEKAPLFRRNLRCIDDLTENTKLSGLVRNVTHFGAFVDVGIGRDALIPNKLMKGQRLSLGDKVEASVSSIDRKLGRVTLML